MRTASRVQTGCLLNPSRRRGQIALPEVARTSILSLPILIALIILAASLAHAQTIADSGFSAETVTTLPVYQPVGLTFAPDGRIFIWQENGIVKVFKNGVLLPTPFINLQPRVNTLNDRGLLGLALDPNFPANGYVYLLYTYEEGNNPSNPSPKTARLTRVTASSSNPDVAQDGTEIVILGTIGTPPCSNYPAGTDCIPSDADSHTIGTLRFGSDGKLFVGIGDGAGYDAVEPLALRAQDLNSYSGKILRINTNGSAPGNNPFDDGTNSIRSKVYSYGLRNPYRFSLHPVTGEVYLGDVGWNSWEEINRGRGANFGWPCFEGQNPQPLYQAAYQQCRDLSNGAVTPPLYTYPHPEGNAAIGGSFYTATQYPVRYRGDYFFADYVGGFIRRMTFGENGQLLGVQSFATDVIAPVSLELGPDGALYYISLSTGEVRRIKFSGPVAKASASTFWGYSPLNVSFSSSGSLDPNGGTISYLWDFGDGATSTSPNPSHTYTSPSVRTFDARLTVTDMQARSATDRVTITIGSTPPTATIVTPANGMQVSPGDVVNFFGAATDPDQTLPNTSLSWQVLLHHDDHVHPFITATGTSGSFTVESHGQGSYSYEIILTATDGSGLTDTKSVTLPVTTSPVPAPWLNRDVGSVGVTGIASYTSGTFFIQGSGADIWDQTDAFHFVYQPLNGDGEIVARVVGLTATHSNAKAGVMIRESLTSDSRHAILDVTPAAGTEFMRRLNTGTLTTFTSGGNEAAPKWFKLTRTGNSFSASKSNDGIVWTLIGTDTINMTTQVYIGLVVTSHNDAVLCDATFDNVVARTFGGNAPPNVSITSPANGATFTSPANVIINASATDSDGIVSRVDFYNGAALIGSDTSAPYSFTWNSVATGSYALTAKAMDNLGAISVSSTVNISVNPAGTSGFTDDFNDNAVDPAKWTYGTIQGAIYSGPSAWDATVPVLERNQRLEISPRSGVTGDHYNGYVSVATWSLSNARATVELVQAASGGTTNTELALCVDSRNFLMISIESGVLRFEQVVNGVRSTTSTTYNSTQHRFWRIRHDSLADSINFETSSDGLAWIVRRTVVRQLPLGALKVEISAGTWQGVSSPGTAIFDNFNLLANSTAPVNNPPSVNITSPVNNATFVAPASITIDANASDTDGSVSRVDFYSGTNLIGTDNTAPYSFTWNNVALGSYQLSSAATDNNGALTTSSPVNVIVTAATSLPAPWLKTDIGTVGLPGDASFATGVFSVRGSGADIWGRADAFQYVYQTLNGNGQIVARVTGVQITDQSAKAGVMIRETLTPGSRNASMLLTAGSGLSFQRRTTTNGTSTRTSGGSGIAPYWVRLVRNGNQISAYRSTDGVAWVQVGSTISITMTTNIYIGLAVTSHNNSVLCLSTFDSVSVTAGLRILPALGFGL